MIPEEVFHYTKACSAIKILSGKRVRLSQFKETNDPREARKWAIPSKYVGAAPITQKDIITDVTQSSEQAA